MRRLVSAEVGPGHAFTIFIPDELFDDVCLSCFSISCSAVV